MMKRAFLFASVITAGAVALVMTKRQSTVIGENAKVGDQVDVPTASLPEGGLPAAIPQGVGYIVVTVQQVGQTMLAGPITGYVTTVDPRIMVPLAVPVGPVQVPKAAVVQVTRSGSKVA